jgi:hypothetical protein
VALGKTREHRPDAIERWGRGTSEHVAIASATFEAVLSRHRTRKGCQQPGKFIDRPAAYQGEGTVEAVGERTKELRQLWRHFDRVGCSGDFDQRSIEIEKQRLMALQHPRRAK